MKILLAVALGGAVGATARFLMAGAVGRMAGTDFPWGILVANVLGSFLMGVLVDVFALVWSPSQEMRALLTVGVLGGFTTFSSFSLDTVLLLQRGEAVAAMVYVGASVVLSVAALLTGMALVRALAS